MAKIMCRYSVGPRCELHVPKFNRELCSDVFPHHSKPCSVFEPNRKDVCNPDCVHMVYPIRQFEGEYKNYELDEWELTVGKRIIPLDAIHKLVVDGHEVEFKFGKNGLKSIIWWE